MPGFGYPAHGLGDHADALVLRVSQVLHNAEFVCLRCTAQNLSPVWFSNVPEIAHFAVQSVDMSGCSLRPVQWLLDGPSQSRGPLLPTSSVLSTPVFAVRPSASSKMEERGTRTVCASSAPGIESAGRKTNEDAESSGWGLDAGQNDSVRAGGNGKTSMAGRAWIP